MNQETTKIIESNVMTKAKSDAIVKEFKSFVKTVEEWAVNANKIVVTDESQTDVMLQAKEARLLLKNKRIEIEKKRKSLKEQSLNEGRLIDSIAKSLTSLIEPAEKHLEAQERYVEILEKKRMVELEASRVKQLLPYQEVIDVNSLQLDIMTDEAFESILNYVKFQLKQKEENEKARKEEEEATKKKEEEEKLEAQEREKKLKAEAEERENSLAKEREENKKLKAEAEERENALAKEREENDKLKAEAEERENALAKEREEKESIKTSSQNIHNALVDYVDNMDVVDPIEVVEKFKTTESYSIEIVIALEREIDALKKKNEVALDTLNKSLAYIIHPELRVAIEFAVKFIKS